MTWIFWISILLVFLTYFGYPILLGFYSLFNTYEVKRNIILPRVTIIIPFYNAEGQLSKKFDNTLQLNYPKELLDIIAVSDCSQDSSDEIAKSYSNRGVRNFRLEKRSGKHYAQERALKYATGEIIIFTDVGILLSPDTVELLVRNFADPLVGCVSSTDMIIEQDGRAVNSEGAYIRYDMWLRKMESKVCSSTGMSGSLYAARKELCDNWIPYLSNDYYIALRSVMRGFKSILDDEVIGYYQLVSSHQQEFIRKVRTIIHGIEVLFEFKGILNPFRYGFYSFEVIGHKLMRWLVPFFLILILVSNIFLVTHGVFYQSVMVLQLLFYLIALLSHRFEKIQAFAPFRVICFFSIANLSILVAWYNFVLGKKFIIWEPSKR